MRVVVDVLDAGGMTQPRRAGLEALLAAQGKKSAPQMAWMWS